MIKVLKSSNILNTWYLSSGIPDDGDGTSFETPLVWQLHSSDSNQNFNYTTPVYGNYVYVLLNLTGNITYSGTIVANTGPISYMLYSQSDSNTVLQTFSYYDSTTFSFSVAETGLYIFKCGEEFYVDNSTETLILTPAPNIMSSESIWKKLSIKLSTGLDEIGHMIKYQDIEDANIIYNALWSNTKNTKFYLNFTQTDISSELYTINYSSITWDTEIDPIFNDSGTSYFSIPDFDKTVFGSGSEWTIDFWFNLSSSYSSWNNLLVQTNNSNGDNYLDESLGLGINSTPSLCFYYAATNCGLGSSGEAIFNTNLVSNQWYHVAIDKYLKDSLWHLTYYVNGISVKDILLTKEILPFQSHDVSFGGINDDSGRRFRGTLCRPRITSIALFKGNDFTLDNRI